MKKPCVKTHNFIAKWSIFIEFSLSLNVVLCFLLLKVLRGDEIVFRNQGQDEDEETRLYYNRFRYYDSFTGSYISQDPIRLQGGSRLYGYVHDPNTWLDPFGLTEKTTVGRWVSQTEYDEMLKTGKVVESHSGTTHVANPASADAFGKQAKDGALYVEFDVDSASLKQTGKDWASISGPNSVQGRLAKKKGLPIPQMPDATNIKAKAKKVDGKIVCH